MRSAWGGEEGEGGEWAMGARAIGRDEPGEQSSRESSRVREREEESGGFVDGFEEMEHRVSVEEKKIMAVGEQGKKGKEAGAECPEPADDASSTPSRE